MTDEIIEMARQAGYDNIKQSGIYMFDNFDVEAFAKLVAAKERERVIATLKNLDTVCNEDGGYDEPSRQDCIWAIEGIGEA